jgi:hypothetical protein
MGICSIDSKKFWSKSYGCLLANVFPKRLFVKKFLFKALCCLLAISMIFYKKKVPHNNIYKTLEKKSILG